MTTQTIKLYDFTKQEVEWLSDLVTEKLNDMDKTPESFAFNITVEFLPREGNSGKNVTD